MEASTYCSNPEAREGSAGTQELSSQLLSCVGKLMECRRMLWFLETHDILSPTQTGYRQNRSTEDQWAYLAQEIENAFQEKKKALAVFFDLSKAFDKVWKEGLLSKILDAGITGKMFHWVRGFLFQRTARVKLDGCLSQCQIT